MLSNTKWGKRLEDLLAAIPDSQSVSMQEVQSGETVVGILPDALRRLACVTDNILREHNELAKEHSQPPGLECTPSNCKHLAAISEMHDDYAFTIKMFIKAVQEEFDVKGKIIGVRAGNQIVLASDQTLYEHSEIGILGDGSMIPVGAPLA